MALITTLNGLVIGDGVAPELPQVDGVDVPAALAITSTTKAFLHPTLTAAQAAALEPKVPGLVWYDSDSEVISFTNNSGTQMGVTPQPAGVTGMVVQAFTHTLAGPAELAAAGGVSQVISVSEFTSTNTVIFLGGTISFYGTPCTSAALTDIDMYITVAGQLVANVENLNVLVNQAVPGTATQPYVLNISDRGRNLMTTAPTRDLTGTLSLDIGFQNWSTTAADWNGSETPDTSTMVINVYFALL